MSSRVQGTGFVRELCRETELKTPQRLGVTRYSRAQAGSRTKHQGIHSCLDIACRGQDQAAFRDRFWRFAWWLWGLKISIPQPAFIILLRIGCIQSP